MPLDWKEIAYRAHAFTKDWHHLLSEDADAKTFWKCTLLIEHKSRGQDLGKALRQARDYLPGLKPDEEPRYILVCDFRHFELHDLLEFHTHEDGSNAGGVLDYVAGWYVKAARYITTAPDSFAGVAAAASRDRKKFKDVNFGGIGFGDLFADVERLETLARRKVRCGFVSTNSITQGEQVAPLWGWMAYLFTRYEKLTTL